MLGALFPAVRDTNPSRAGAGRFAHPDYFDRYLAQAIPEGDIPDAVVSQALDKAAAGASAELHALVNANDDEVTLALSKVRARYLATGEMAYLEGARGPVTVELLAAGMTLLDKAADRLDTWTSTAQQLTYWMSDLLRLVLDADPAADVDPALTTCTQAHRRAHVISTASRDVESLKPEIQQALRGAQQREVQRLLPILLADLRQGDQSRGESGSTFLYQLVAESPSLTDLQAEIARGSRPATSRSKTSQPGSSAWRTSSVDLDAHQARPSQANSSPR